MKTAPALSLAFLLTAGAVLLDPPDSTACGPFFPEVQFGYIHQPPLDAYARGQLGIVRPGYYRKYLVIAYRYFTNAPLTQAEIGALTAPPPPYQTPDNAATPWLTARNAVPGIQPITRLDTERNFTKGNEWNIYLNCLPDAFSTATETLAARIKRWGASSPLTLDWIAGQDQVFANCSGGPPPPWQRQNPNAPPDQPKLPPPAPQNADATLRADRQYQTAAALFYATRYDEAATAFRDIHQPYLAARALIRKGSVDGDTTAYTAAETALQAILADPAQSRWHNSARGLLAFVEGRLHPLDRMTALADSLSKPDPNIAQDLTDFTMLWDHNNNGPTQTSDLADWIATFQSRQSQHALERWHATQSKAWFVAAIASAGPKDTAAPDLIAAARKLAPADPAFATATDYGLALASPDEARTWTTEALAISKSPDLTNALHHIRLKVDRSFAEFLADAPRLPVAETTDTDDQDPDNTDLTFDTDAAGAFNEQIPLALWIEAAQNPLLPKHLQSEIAQAAWVRAIVLGRTPEAAELARRTGLIAPDATHFDAIFLMLHDPGLTPWVRPGYPRREKYTELDPFRDNWWGIGPQPQPEKAPASTAAPFLPPAQGAQGLKEHEQLVATAALAPNYLAAQTLAFAKAHPQDPRIPEALHLAVRATRYGVTDKQTTNFSRECFQLLHSRYGSTKWAEMTKYWY